MRNDREKNLKYIADLYRQLYREMFACAYAVTGNDRTAETALINAMCMRVSNDEDTAKNALENVKRCAVYILKTTPAEINYNCLEADFTNTDPFSEWLTGLKEEDRRAVMLKYGLGFKTREISGILAVSQQQVRSIFERIRQEGAKYHSSAKKMSSALKKLCQKEITGASFAPDYNSVIRAVEKLNESGEKKEKFINPIGRVVSWMIAIAAMGVMIAIIWMCAVMMGYYRDAIREEKIKDAQYREEAAPGDIGSTSFETEDPYAVV
ncbi:MAG: sigma-70 family RNA polymerase sigma factor [Clostridia bacterium]|nr:sigma-70 family RNA polymerase sigma factor [Clostridia bacterium]